MYPPIRIKNFIILLLLALFVKANAVTSFIKIDRACLISNIKEGASCFKKAIKSDRVGNLLLKRKRKNRGIPGSTPQIPNHNYVQLYCIYHNYKIPVVNKVFSSSLHNIPLKRGPPVL